MRANTYEAKITALARATPERCAAPREGRREVPAVLRDADPNGPSIRAEPKPWQESNIWLLRYTIDAGNGSKQDRQSRLGRAQ